MKEKVPLGFERLLDVVPVLVWTARDDGFIDYVNARWTDYTGLPIDQGLGWRWLGIVHPDDVERTRDVWEVAVANRTTLEVQLRFRRSDGVYRWHMVRAIPVVAGGRAARWIGSSFDIDRQKRVEQTLTFLAQANETLSASLDVRAPLDRLAALVVPEIADWCAVYFDDSKTTVASDERDFPGRDIGQREVMSTGKPFVTRKSAVFPMVAADRVVGTLSLAMDESGRGLGDSDSKLAMLLASRTAIAVANAALFEREHRAADLLQRALLPPLLPRIEGARFEACYVTADSKRDVGGDWYDAFVLDDRRVLVSIGDVAGKGLTAATTMGRVRDSLRAAALCNDDPVCMLQIADDALRDESGIFVTSFAGIWNRVTGTFTYANAGHHPPRLRGPDGGVHVLEEHGLPLGVQWAAREQRPSGNVALEPGSLLVLFTDGLIEQTRDPQTQLSRLDRAIDHLPAAGAATSLRDAFVVPPSRDDVAILMLYVE